MTSLPLLIALSSVGIDAGWQPLKDGGLEYTVQIEPAQLRMLKPGDELVSEIPPKSRDIRRIRITVGTEKLARTDLPSAPPGEEKVLAAKSVVVPATATESIAGPRFPGDPPAAEKDAVADLKVDSPPIAKPPVENRLFEKPESEKPLGEKSLTEQPLVDKPSAETRVVGYPKAETALTSLPAAPAGDEAIDWRFAATAIGLVASLGANFFLFWTAWGAYGRYRTLVRRMNARAAPA